MKAGARAGAAFVFAATLAVYATMISANVALGDEAEAQTVPSILGIAHPTGFPAYTLLGWLFAHALPLGTIAWRLNLFTALCTALTATGVFLIALTCADDVAVAVLAALAFAFGGTVWHTALNANAQSLATPCEIFALYGCLRFARSGDARALVCACACCGLGIADHPFAMWVVPAIPVALAWQHKRITLPVVAAGVAAFAVPLVLYGYFPLRSAYVAAHGLDPNAGAPLFGAGGFDWDANAPRTVTGFLNEVLARHELAGGNFSFVLTHLSAVATPRWWFDVATKQYAGGLLLLAALGTLVLVLRDRPTFTVLAAGTLGGAAFAYVYRRDDHIDRYTLAAFAVTAAVVAASANAGLLRRPARVLRSLVIVVLAIAAGTSFVQNRAALGALAAPNGQAAIDAARRQTPDGAIIVAQWPDAAALGYGAFVEHDLGSRRIVSAWPAEYAARYAAWAATGPVLIEQSFGPDGRRFAPAMTMRPHR